MENLALVSTSTKITSPDYPYGFRERTTMYDYLEFSPKHGFRHCSQTVNPKTNRLNNPKKSTYYPVMVLGTDEKGHVQSKVLAFSYRDKFNGECAFMAEHFHLFTAAEIEYIYAHIIMTLKVEAQSIVTYCGADVKQVLEIIRPALQKAMQGFKSKGTENVFAEIVVDVEAIEACKVPDFQPFKVTSYGRIA